ncbi:putative ATPase [Clostridium beijerinckii]|nr:AAA family ATPase [Clostridium beijerinckii]MBA8933967.1 putative ATPase [Clostridium beijerinckii]NRU38161.1 putative ATPase [Clostridium beijerinckii]NSA98560.1 putative ATPase [Clostridium beijerinckii]OOM58897.1 DNA replication and repair protein RecF [Clostridium beijerinckii]OOM67233.1 DNA replication and repair protein RecF [Clostridium beijerinckii]
MYIKEIRLKKEIYKDDSYIKELPVVNNLISLDISSNVTFFVGENGSGKSTLLEAIAVNSGFNAEGGTKNFCFSSRETHSDLYKYIIVVKGVQRPRDGFFLRAESFYNVATEIEKLDLESSGGVPVIKSYGGTSLHKMSHGESFITLMTNRFSGNGLYILDEPEAALSPLKQMAMLTTINELVKKRSQFIIATHSPILMAYPDADIFVIDDDGITKTPYKKTDNYMITRKFLENPEKMIGYLFE